MTAELGREIAYERHDPGGGVAGVAAHSHRCRAGVGRLAGDRDLGPRDALHSGDDADLDALVLQDRSLLDVQLDVAVWERRRRARHRAGVSDPRQLVTEAGSAVS